METFRSVEDTGNRRSACNRCRHHKLRCERDLESSQCRRCLKANTECVIGAALKSGRPLQLYGAQQYHQHIPRDDSPSVDVVTNHQQALPEFPTPPATNLDKGFEPDFVLQDTMLDIQFLRSPSGFTGVDPLWTDHFEQTTALTSLIPPFVEASMKSKSPRNPFTTTLNKHGEHMKRIGELQTEILIDLETVRGCTTACNCSSVQMDQSSDQRYNFLIGRMLDHATALIEILECFEPVSQSSRSCTEDGGFRNLHVSRERLSCDAPTMFSLVSCYVCLVRIFRTIFSCIHDSMSFLLGSPQPPCQLFPGMNLGGFKLETRVDLQIQILVQVSEDVLSRVEARFGISANEKENEASIFDQRKVSQVLRMMLDEEASEKPPLNDNRGDCAPLVEILASIKRAIQINTVRSKD